MFTTVVEIDHEINEKLIFFIQVIRSGFQLMRRKSTI